jgi:uncharacterized membrane protein YoaT (DUF817 family)
MWVGFALAVGAQLVAFFHILKRDPPKAILALILPGYVLYYVWKSDDKMPRLLRFWVIGVLMFVAGGIGLVFAMEL